MQYVHVQYVCVVLAGGASSGKSTFIKQLRIHQGDGIPDSERVRLKPYIFENLMDALNVCIDNMSSLGIEYEHDKNQVRCNLKLYFTDAMI